MGFNLINFSVLVFVKFWVWWFLVLLVMVVKMSGGVVGVLRCGWIGFSDGLVVVGNRGIVGFG